MLTPARGGVDGVRHPLELHQGLGGKHVAGGGGVLA